MPEDVKARLQCILRSNLHSSANIGADFDGTKGPKQIILPFSVTNYQMKEYIYTFRPDLATPHCPGHTGEPLAEGEMSTEAGERNFERPFAGALKSGIPGDDKEMYQED